MRRLFTLSVVLALTLGVNVTPASAHDTSCNSGSFCVWQHGSFTGFEHEHFTASENDWDFFGIENDDDSVKNKRTSNRVLVYNEHEYDFLLYCMEAGEEEDDINSALDDQGDSSLFSGFTSCGTLPRP